MTKFTVTRENPSKKEDKDYEIIREYKREREHVMKLEKELKAHEKTDISHAHYPFAIFHRINETVRQMLAKMARLQS